ncbi:MAG: chemotaxis protein CheW [Microcystaceae cyanobacterium]
MANFPPQPPTSPTNCWKSIGVFGDRSCEKLEQINHCHNCPVYQVAGRELLSREIPPEYAEQWTNLLAKPSISTEIGSVGADTEEKETIRRQDNLSVLIFRLGEEWFALPVWVIKEVTPLCPIHTVPHRSNNIFTGIVNIRGEILMCIALGNVLTVGSSESLPYASCSLPSQQSSVYARTIVMEIQENRWAFRVDEIVGIHRLDKKNLQDVPVVISKTPDTYTKKILQFEDRKINYLNYELLFYELLFYTLNRSSV